MEHAPPETEFRSCVEGLGSANDAFFERFKPGIEWPEHVVMHNGGYFHMHLYLPLSCFIPHLSLVIVARLETFRLDKNAVQTLEALGADGK